MTRSIGFNWIFFFFLVLCFLFSPSTCCNSLPSSSQVSSSSVFLFSSFRPFFPRLACRGVHPSEAMMHFPPCFSFPQFQKTFSHSVENFPNFTFSEKLFDLHPPNFLMTFCLVTDHKF